jgi:hypothetical protein
MKVKQLIAILEAHDPEATVLIMSQQSWPSENAVYGVTTRSELEETDEADGEDADAPAPGRDGRAASDVFIVEGTQLRYGSKTAWEVAAR